MAQHSKHQPKRREHPGACGAAKQKALNSNALAKKGGHKAVTL
jgi:hypothetical protein